VLRYSAHRQRLYIEIFLCEKKKTANKAH